MTFANSQREVKKGDFVYLPPWCEHAIENTGTETLVAGTDPMSCAESVTSPALALTHESVDQSSDRRLAVRPDYIPRIGLKTSTSSLPSGMIWR